jgi:hypothetical protein
MDDRIRIYQPTDHEGIPQSGLKWFKLALQRGLVDEAAKF